MIFNILIYAFPAMFMILGAYLLIYRRTLLEVFGDYSNKVIIIFSILLFLVGILGFILVVNNLIDLMLIWMLAALRRLLYGICLLLVIQSQQWKKIT